MSLADLRKTYQQGALHEADALPSPVDQFTAWFEQALQDNLLDPNAMTLATVKDDGRPAARIVLLKDYDERGFVFYTNYHSSKGHQLEGHPWASLLFFWAPHERQIRIEGRVEKVSDAQSDAYFKSRPLASRIGAWASDQSTEIPRREWLREREAEFRARLGDDPPRPPHWGGYRVVPNRFEFWQGRPSRLHDRLAYVRDAESGGDAWRLARLSP